MKSVLGFVVFVVVVVGFLLLFPGKTYPPIPDDDFHKAIRDNSSCMECHGPGKRNELKKSHPPKFECLKCHALKRIASALPVSYCEVSERICKEDILTLRYPAVLPQGSS